MSSELTEKRYLVLVALGLGLFFCLEGLGVTAFTSLTPTAPRPLLVLFGLSFLLAALSIQFGSKRPRLNHLLAAIVMTVMGGLFVWVSLFGSPEWYSSSLPTGLALQRIAFAAGAVLCFIGSASAFRVYLKHDR